MVSILFARDGVVAAEFGHEAGYDSTRQASRHLKDHFQLDRGAKRKACDAVHQPARVLVFSENVLQQLRSAVSNFRLIADISRSGHRHAEPDDPSHFVKSSQILTSDGEGVELCEAR